MTGRGTESSAGRLLEAVRKADVWAALDAQLGARLASAALLAPPGPRTRMTVAAFCGNSAANTRSACRWAASPGPRSSWRAWRHRLAAGWRPVAEPRTPPSTTRLGDSYADLLNVGHERLVLCVSELTRSRVIVRASARTITLNASSLGVTRNAAGAGCSNRGDRRRGELNSKHNASGKEALHRAAARPGRESRLRKATGLRVLVTALAVWNQSAVGFVHQPCGNTQAQRSGPQEGPSSRPTPRD